MFLIIESGELKLGTIFEFKSEIPFDSSHWFIFLLDNSGIDIT